MIAWSLMHRFIDAEVQVKDKMEILEEDGELYCDGVDVFALI